MVAGIAFRLTGRPDHSHAHILATTQQRCSSQEWDKETLLAAGRHGQAAADRAPEQASPAVITAATDQGGHYDTRR